MNSALQWTSIMLLQNSNSIRGVISVSASKWCHCFNLKHLQKWQQQKIVSITISSIKPQKIVSMHITKLQKSYLRNGVLFSPWCSLFFSFFFPYCPAMFCASGVKLFSWLLRGVGVGKEKNKNISEKRRLALLTYAFLFTVFDNRFNSILA